MSEAITFADVLKSAPTASSLSGISMLCADSSGELQKADRQLTPLCLKEAGASAPDLNEMRTFGIWRVQSSSPNAPAGIYRGIIEVLPYASGQLYQRITAIDTAVTPHLPTMLLRSFSEDVWSDWVKLT